MNVPESIAENLEVYYALALKRTADRSMLQS
jgi:hypothetical protein